MRDVRARALIVTQYYRPELLGSAPYCADLAEWLTQRGWRVTVMAGLPHYPDADAFAAQRDEAIQREVINGVHVERLRSRIPARASAFSRIAAELSFFFAGLRALLSGRIRREPLVISLCPSILSVALGALMCRRGGRHVALVHDIQSGLAKGLNMVKVRGLAAVMRAAERFILNRVDLVAVLTPEMADELRANGVRRAIEILPIWVDLDRFAPLVAAGRGPVRIVYSGNLGRKQGLGQIVDLAGELQRIRPELRITVRGRGNQADALHEDIEQRSLRNIRFEDPLAPEALERGLAEADIHLVPQAPDAATFALPSKIFNIMAAGRPFVATAHPGSPLWRIREVSGAFLCVPPGNARAYAEAVLQLVDDAEQRHRLGERGRKFVARHNARSKVLSDFEASIDALHAN